MQRTVFLCIALIVLAGGPLAAQCKPTPGAILDPTYTPAAPERGSVGSGFVLTGTVRASDDCLPIEGATVEFWLAGPDGYTEKLRGTVVVDKNGRYRIQCPFPSASTGRAPHIHMNIGADGFLPIQTEFLPTAGSKNGVFDIYLKFGD